MGTDGAVGFIKNNHLTTIYNRMDSYPSGLGNDVLDFIRKYGVKEINRLVDSFILTDEEDEAIPLYSLGDFWCREKKEILIYDDTSFLYNSLYCEWVYIINLDTNKFEVYKGMNKEKPKGRFSEVPKNANGYYAVSLIKIIPLNDLPPEL